MKVLRSIISVASIMLAAPYVHAWEFAGGFGSTGEGEKTVRLGVTHQWDKRWFDSNIGHLTGYWDAGYTYWESGKYSARHALSVSPVLVYEFHLSGSIKPFIELGVGVAAFSGTRVGSNNLGSAFNFEDRIGLGVNINDIHRIGVRAIHYSNAGIKKPNAGIESYSLFYSFKF